MAKYSFDDIRPARAKRPMRAKKENELFPKTLHDDLESSPVQVKKETEARVEDIRSGETEVIMPRREEGSRIGMWLIATGVLLVLIFSIAGLFSGATITVTPKSERMPVSDTWNADSKDAGDILFQVMNIPIEKSMEIPATGERDVERQSSGTIIIYNDYSSASQRLVRNTRFETPDGKIYRINASVTVPGRKSAGNPGSVETVVYAEAPGESYNIGLTDFTLPGFKGTPQYEKFYARSKTPMEGGFVGVEKIASTEDLKKAEENLSLDIETELRKKAFAEKPAGYLLYSDAIFISKGALVQAKESPSGKVLLSMKGTLRANLLPERELARLVAEEHISGFDGGDVLLENAETLSFVIEEKDKVAPEDTSFDFTLSGDAHVVWVVDEKALKEKIAGIPKKSFNTILSAFPYIERAEASLRPFWKRVFPENVDNIKIEIVKEQ